MKENDKEPRLILVQGVGAFIMEDDKGKAAKAQLLGKRMQSSLQCMQRALAARCR